MRCHKNSATGEKTFFRSNEVINNFSGVCWGRLSFAANGSGDQLRAHHRASNSALEIEPTVTAAGTSEDGQVGMKLAAPFKACWGDTQLGQQRTKAAKSSSSSTQWLQQQQ